MTDLTVTLKGVKFIEQTIKQVEDHLRSLATYVAPEDDYVFYFEHSFCVTDTNPKDLKQGGVLYAEIVRKDDKRTFRNGRGEYAKLIPHNEAIMHVIKSQREFLKQMRDQLAQLKNKAA